MFATDPAAGTPLSLQAPTAQAMSLAGQSSVPTETALDRYKRLLQEAMVAADEARAEVGEVTAYHLQLIAEEATSPLQNLLNDVCDRIEEDFELGCARAAAYRAQVRSDYRAGIGL